MAEKPIATRTEEHCQLLERFPAHHLACGFQRRTFATTRAVRRILDDGWLAAARTHLGSLVGAAAGGDYPAAPGTACHGCDFLRFCEEGTSWVEAEQS